MKILNPTFQWQQFWGSVRSAPHAVLLLDYDGTLAPFHDDRFQAVPYPGVRERLAALMHLPRARLALVTGRSAADLVPLVGLEPPPEIWGAHGWERRLIDGCMVLAEPPPQQVAGFEQARDWVRRNGLTERLEDKRVSLAFHLRGVPEATARGLRLRVAEAWGEIARRTGVELKEFDGGLELRAPDRTKGHAVETLRAEMGPQAVIACLGDDLTDEDAFLALKGHGLPVLVRPEFRPTAADVWLRPPDELLWFLDEWYNACGGTA